MQVIPAKEMQKIEQLAYSEGASEDAFMEEAGRGVHDLIFECINWWHIPPKIALLCGRGNNAGDAFVAGRLLCKKGFEVEAFAISPLSECSSPCQKQWNQFVKAKGVVHQVTSEIDFGEANLLVDGLLGTGFHGTVSALYREVIEAANRSGLPILAIDVPSGIDGNTGEIGGVAIRATETLFLGLPKLGCFLGEAWAHTGRVFMHNFGLDEKYIEKAESKGQLITEELIRALLPAVHRTRHKYEVGYVVGVAGSPGMPGAPLLASEAALRSGAGIVRLFHSEGMESDLASAPYELIRHPFKDLAPIFIEMRRAASLFFGPGIGMEAKALLEELFAAVDKPCVIDADALNLIAAHDLKIPKGAVLTPHIGEVKRLLHLDTTPGVEELHALCQEYCERHEITLVLKGAPTWIFYPQSIPYICPRGDAGMATAGSGDVLTGIIAAFLAQTKDPLKGALLGVYFHSRAGEVAAKEWSSDCMIASDITHALPDIFHTMRQSERAPLSERL